MFKTKKKEKKLNWTKIIKANFLKATHQSRLINIKSEQFKWVIQNWENFWEYLSNSIKL